MFLRRLSAYSTIVRPSSPISRHRETSDWREVMTDGRAQLDRCTIGLCAHGTVCTSWVTLRDGVFFRSIEATRSLDPDPHWEMALIACVKGTLRRCTRSGVR